MIKKIKLMLLLMISFSSIKGIAQEIDQLLLQSIAIKPELKEDANAVIRLEEVTIHLESSNKVVVKTRQVITVLNAHGNKHVSTYEWYDPSTKIRKQQAIFYDLIGNEIKKYKRGDFEDRSAVDGNFITDNRIKYIEHTPVSYPYTVVYESELVNTSTAFLTRWSPIKGYYVSVEKSKYTIENPKNLTLKKKEYNLSNFDVISTENGYVLENSKALEPEAMSPSFSNFVPKVAIALQNFELVSVQGEAKDWSSFGLWQYENLVSGRNVLPEETIKEISTLTSKATSNKEKAKIIYEYVQNKTRYISVQLGIGGWLPMQASQVDRLGYGDCKALTNYTKALLDSQKIPAYYTVVFAGENKRHIDKDFVAMQGNHVILNVPDGEEDVWLECTSQTMPFNFIGDFTDDRDVLVIKPEGGIIKRTKKYTPEENQLETKGTITINEDRSIIASVEMNSKGIQYDQRYYIDKLNTKDQDEHYKEYWDYINNLNLKEIKFKNDKDDILFTENITIEAANYAKKIGNRLLFIPNVFNRDQGSLLTYKDRQREVEITRGFYDIDEYEITIPSGYNLSVKPEDRVIENTFGKYTYEVRQVDDRTLKLKRTLKILDGIYPKEAYEIYKTFKKEIKKTDKSKILLIKE